MKKEPTMQDQNRIPLVSGLDAEAVCKYLCLASDEEGWHRRVLAFYLVEMDEQGLHVDSGHGSTAHFACAWLDMERRRVNELIQTGRALRNLELLDEAYREGAVSWSKVIALLPVIQVETQGRWVDFARDSTFRTLRATVRACRAGDLPGDAGDYGLIHRMHVAQARLGARDKAMFEAARRRFSADPDEPMTDDELIRHLLHRSLPDWKPEPAAAALPAAERNHTGLPAETREQVLRRDQHRCRNCHGHVAPQVHHIEPRAQGGSNDPGNLVTLCQICHGLIHRGLLFLEHDPGGQGFVFYSRHRARTDRRGVRSPGLPRPPSGRTPVLVANP
jgi:hypothetical protein